MSERVNVEQSAGSVVVGIDQLDTLLDLAGKVIIVSSNLEALNRRIEAGEGESEEGVGTAFSFTLPNISAVNIADTLMVKAAQTVYAFPIASVVASLYVKTHEFHQLPDGGRTVFYLREHLPVADLSGVFGDPPEPPGEDACLLVVHHKSAKVAFVVGEFIAPQKVVIAERDELVTVEGIHGAAVLSGQRLGLVVDVPCLIGRVRSPPIAQVAAWCLERGRLRWLRWPKRRRHSSTPPSRPLRHCLPQITSSPSSNLEPPSWRN